MNNVTSLRRKPALRIVQADEDHDPHAYEAEQRRWIMGRDWASVHTAADRREPINIPDRIKRTWFR